MALSLLLTGAACANLLWARRPPELHYRVDFARVPRQVGDLKAKSVPVEQRIFNYLGADAMEELAYRAPDQEVRLALVYGADWRAVHSPLSCLPQTGWQVGEKRLIDIAAPVECPHPGPLHGQLLRARRAQEQLAVLYVFAHRGGTTGDWMKQGWAVSQAPRGTGGLMLSLSTSVRPGETEAAEELLKEVLTGVYVSAVSFWYR